MDHHEGKKMDGKQSTVQVNWKWYMYIQDDERENKPLIWYLHKKEQKLEWLLFIWKQEGERNKYTVCMEDMHQRMKDKLNSKNIWVPYLVHVSHTLYIHLTGLYQSLWKNKKKVSRASFVY
jgi:hypothetical protein